jgi:hypothetical protein
MFFAIEPSLWNAQLEPCKHSGFFLPVFHWLLNYFFPDITYQHFGNFFHKTSEAIYFETYFVTQHRCIHNSQVKKKGEKKKSFFSHHLTDFLMNEQYASIWPDLTTPILLM